MSGKSHLLKHNHGPILPKNSNTFKSLSFHRAVLILISSALILQLLVDKFATARKLDNHARQQEEQQLRGFTSSHEEGDNQIRLWKSTIYHKVENEANITEQNLNQQQPASIPHPNITIVNTTSASVINSNKNITTWPISLFDKQEKEMRQCWLSSITDMLGCGFHGHAFSAVMQCHQNNDTNADVAHHKVVFKARFQREDRKGDRVYVSMPKSDIRKWVEYHTKLLGNTVTSPQGDRNMRKYFHLPFGKVSVSPTKLWEAVAKDFKCGKNDNPLEFEETKEAIRLELSPPPVLGIVMEDAGTEYLQPDKLTTTDEQRRIVKDLVYIFHHMHKRNFIHQDILYRHIPYDGEHVSLIDFDSSGFVRQRIDNIHEETAFNATILKSKLNSTSMQKKQTTIIDCDHSMSIETGERRKIRGAYQSYIQNARLSQLLSLIGSVCTKTVNIFPGAERERFERDDFQGAPDNTDFADHPLVQNWTLAFRQCSFMNQPSLLFDKNFTISQVYQILSVWTSNCSNQ